MQDPSPQGPLNAAAPRIEDHTSATTTPPAGAGRTTGAIFAGPRTISRTTVTHAAFPQCTSYSIQPLYPAIQGKTTTSMPPLMCTAPPCDYKRRRRASFRVAGSDALSRRTLRRFRTWSIITYTPAFLFATFNPSSSRDLGAFLPLSPRLYPLQQALRVQDNTVPLHTPFAGRTAPRPEPG